MDNTTFDTNKIIKGIKKTTALIRPAYGNAGGNAILEHRLYPFYQVSNDAKTIVDAIKLADPSENIGASVIKESGDKMDKISRDGRKTTMIIVDEILDSVKTSKNPIALKKSLDGALPEIYALIDEQKVIITPEEVSSVASISAESEEIGNLIGEIYTQIGKEGIIEIDNSHLDNTFYQITDGVKLRGAKMFGLYSQTEEGRAVCDRPLILISRDKIVSVDQLLPIFDKLHKAGKHQLVIYCEDIDLSVASRLARTHLEGGFKTLLIKSPPIWKDWLYEDFAVMTGATIVDSKSGKPFQSLNLEDLGTCDKLITDLEETRLIGIKDISAHIEKLKELSLTDDQQKVRISWLQTKVATLKIGAGSEVELNYKLKKAKDGCAAAYLALQDGVVPGAGICLMNVANKIDHPTLKEALKGPLLQLLENNGYKKWIFYKMPKDWGEGIQDPALIIKNAVKTAVSIAGTVLTKCGIITLPKEDKPITPNMPIM